MRHEFRATMKDYSNKFSGVWRRRLQWRLHVKYESWRGQLAVVTRVSQLAKRLAADARVNIPLTAIPTSEPIAVVARWNCWAYHIATAEAS
jgi:hypothetical protein